MTILEQVILGVGLAMDAVAVSMTNGMIYKNLRLKDYSMMAIFFGVFQGLMPLIGFYAGSLFAQVITKYGGYVIFLILGIIGGKMVYDSFKRDEEEAKESKLTVGVIFFQAIATSIDAFAVGVGFCAIKVAIIPAVSIIAVTTAIMVVGAIIVGKKFGNVFESKAELIGGLILIAIGIKALL